VSPSASRGELLTGLAAACLISLIANVAVTLFWYTGDRNRITGDEPHYLYIADSVFRDLDFDLENNYEEDVAAPRVVGLRLGRHVNGPKHFSGHAPGLGLLLAVPFAFWGGVGAKLLLCALATLVPLVIYLWMWPVVGTSRATFLTIALCVGLPLAVAANQIFPDALAGVLILVLMFHIARWAESGSRTEDRGQRQASGPRTAQALLFSIVTGLLPWLHVKYAAPMAVLAGSALVFAAAGAERGARLRRAATIIGPAVALVAGLAAYHFVGFGTVLGPRPIAEVVPDMTLHAGAPSVLPSLSIGGISLDPARVLQYLLGMHLDQAQGMFIQQPLLLMGLAGLVVMLRQSPRFALAWALVYLSLIVPSAMSLNYGGFAPAGRFGWSAIWLWVFPMRYAVAAATPALRSSLPIACGLTALYQLWLARLWLYNPLGLYPVVHPSLWARNSLFEGSVRQALPSMYNVNTLFLYVPNWVFVIGCLLLVVSGAALAGFMSTRAARRAWVAFAVVCAVLYPPDAPAWEVPENVRHHVSEMMDEAESLVVRRFEAEQMPSPLGRDSRVADPDASGGYVRRSVSSSPSELMVFGPYLNLPAGRYRLEWVVKLESPPPGESIGTIEVTLDGGRTILGHRYLSIRDFGGAGYVRVPLEFEAEEAMKIVEFRLFADSQVVLRADCVDLVPLKAALRRGWFQPR